MSEREKQPLEYAWEGIDGGGKTTSIKILEDYYAKCGYKVEILSGLSKSPLGVAIRRNLMQLNAMGVAGMKYFKEDIRRSYKSLNGQRPNTDLIFWDRHIYSMAAANCAGCDLSIIRETKPRVSEPSKVFLLDVSPTLAWEREQEAKKGDHPITPGWLVEKYLRYHRIAEMEPERFVIIDASRSLVDVTTQLIAIISEDLRKLGKL